MIKNKNKLIWHLKVQGGNESGRNSGGQIKNSFKNYENNSKNKI